jgi:hypothetical protein
MHEASIGTRLLTRLLIILVAVWSLVAGIVLVAFHGASSGALGAGVADEAGQRLVGAHLLVLAPVYLLIAWHIERYQGLIWLPVAGQLAVVLAVGYSIVTGATDFEDGILALLVSAIFATLLGYVWVTEQRSNANLELDGEQGQSEEAGTPRQQA